jgi:hypothetical protein
MSFPEYSPGIARWCALGLAILASLATIGFAISLVNAETTGVIIYNPNPATPGTLETERVTRNASPAKFSEAVNLTALHATLPAALALVSIWFYRRLSS